MRQRYGTSKWAAGDVSGKVNRACFNKHQASKGHKLAELMFTKDDYSGTVSMRDDPPLSSGGGLDPVMAVAPAAPPTEVGPPLPKDARAFRRYLGKLQKQCHDRRRLLASEQRVFNKLLVAKEAYAAKRRAVPGRCPHCRCDACLAAGASHEEAAVPQDLPAVQS